MKTATAVARNPNQRMPGYWGVKVGEGWENVYTATKPVPGQVYQTQTGEQITIAQPQQRQGGQYKKPSYDPSGQIKGNAVTNAVNMAIAQGDLSVQAIAANVRSVLEVHKAAETIYNEVMGQQSQAAPAATQRTPPAA